MNQRLKRCHAILVALLWAFLFPVGQVRSQDKQDLPAKPDAKASQPPDKKDDAARSGPKDSPTPAKKDLPAAKPYEKRKAGPVKCLVDHDHGQESEAELGTIERFLKEYQAPIQIVAGVMLAVGIAGFVWVRLARGRHSDDEAPPPGEPPAQESV